MDKRGFVKNPLSDKEIEKRSKRILMGANHDQVEDDDEVNEEDTIKSKTHAVMLRVPIPHYKKLLKIKKLTGLTMNGVCLDLLWTAIKLKLDELGTD